MRLPARTASPDILIYLALCAGLMAAGFWLFPQLVADDAYTTLRNAALLARNMPDSTFATDALTGTTSILHSLILAPLTLFLAGETALLLVNQAALLLYAVLAWILASRLAAQTRLAAASAFLSLGIFPLHFFNGLETGLAVSCVLALLLLAKAQTSRQLATLSVLCAAAPFLRPDLAALAAPVMAFALYNNRHHPQRTALILGLFLTVVLLFMSLSVFHTGHMLPQTWQVKSAFYAESCWPLPHRLLEGLRNMGFTLLLYLPASLFLFTSWRGFTARLALVTLLIWFTAYMLHFPSGLSPAFINGRYAVPLAPILLAATLETLGATAARIRLVAQLQAALCLLACLTLFSSPGFVHPAKSILPAIVWAQENIPPGSTILLHDVGYAAYTTKDYNYVDIVGLKSPQAFSLYAQQTAQGCPLPRVAILANVIQPTHARWAIFMTEWVDKMGLAPAVQQAGYNMTSRYQNGLFAVYQLTPQP